MSTKLILDGINLEEIKESNEAELEEYYYKLWEDDRL
jgi:hypothetical protein